MVAAVVLGLAAAAPCPVQDARDVVAQGRQAATGRVVALAGARFTLDVEQARPSIGFGKAITVVRAGLAPVRVGDLVGVVLRPEGDHWIARRCDGFPSARLSKAIQGRDPCPAPRVWSLTVRVSGHVARTVLRLSGDVASLTIAWDGSVRQRIRADNPGLAGLTRNDDLRARGTHRLVVRASGGAGRGCGSRSLRSATVRRTVVVR
jgi:hypothetical protein